MSLTCLPCTFAASLYTTNRPLTATIVFQIPLTPASSHLSSAAVINSRLSKTLKPVARKLPQILCADLTVTAKFRPLAVAVIACQPHPRKYFKVCKINISFSGIICTPANSAPRQPPVTSRKRLSRLRPSVILRGVIPISRILRNRAARTSSWLV